MISAAVCETVTAESIVYERGNVSIRLEGFYAWLYRGMIGMYGKAEATERFWWHWHKKENPNCDSHEAERANHWDEGDYTTK